MAWASEAWKRFQSVASASIQFNEYLLGVHGADKEKMDKHTFMRAAEYSPSSKLLFKGVDQDDPYSSLEDDSSSEKFRTGSNSDGSDGSDEENKISKRGKGKELKNGSKKSKGSSDEEGKSEKKPKKGREN
ncbi:hypothetical protein M434DRAFT_8104 [Hypoxylon sp. CO27-5]|nr:hypothetical protein M434DRAFT_8104 [Hypoxylon sp. CO27-5]